MGELSSTDKDELYSKLTLIIYLEILPILFLTYEREIESEEWNDEAYKKFLREIGEEINKRIDKLLDEVN